MQNDDLKDIRREKTYRIGKINIHCTKSRQDPVFIISVIVSVQNWNLKTYDWFLNKI